MPKSKKNATIGAEPPPGKGFEDALRRAHDEPESRVQERTADPARSNPELQAEAQQRRQVEIELRFHEEIVKNMAEGVVVIRTSDHTILYANPRFEAMLGYGPGELNGKPVTIVNYEEETRSAQQVADEVIAQLDEHGEASYEIKNVKKDGTPVWCMGHTSTIDHPLYGPIWISVHEDITERKHAEEALLESEQKLSTVVEHSLTGIYIIQDGRIVFANPKFAEIYGYAPEDVIGMDHLAFVHPDDLDMVRSHYQARLAGREAPPEYDSKGLTKRGETVWIKRRNRFISHRGRPAVLGNIVDITRQKHMAEELERSAVRLQRLSGQLLESQETERRRIARDLHDSLASDLAAVKFGLQTQRSAMAGDREKQDLEKTISLVQGAMDDLRRIMADLRPSTLEVLGLVETIRAHCREFQSLYGSMQVDCRIEVREEDIPDPLKIIIYRILQEAMNNAVRHSGAHFLQISLSTKNGPAALIVEDNGTGFDVEKARSSGRMGLAGIEERAHLYGGELTIDSGPGKGTVIRAVWPL